MKAKNHKQKMKDIVEKYYSGNFQSFLDHVADHVGWISHKMENVQLKNKQEVIHFLENVPKGRFSFENTKFIIDDNNVVVEGICRYKNKDETPMENFYCDIFTFRNNKIEKVSAYFI